MIMCWCVVAARADYSCLSLWGWTNSLILLAQAEANFDFKGGGGNRTSQFWKWIWKLCLVNLDALLFRALSLKKWEVEWSLKVFSFHIHLLRNWGMSSQDKTSKWGLWGWVQLWFPKHLYPTGKLSDKKAKQLPIAKGSNTVFKRGFLQVSKGSWSKHGFVQRAQYTSHVPKWSCSPVAAAAWLSAGLCFPVSPLATSLLFPEQAALSRQLLSGQAACREA